MENTTNNFDNRNIIKSFCVVGLNENKITKYDGEDAYKFVSNVDIITKNMKVGLDKVDYPTEKWLSINKSKHQWLRIQYTSKYDKPVTSLRVIECEYESPTRLLISKTAIDMGFRPIVICVPEGDEMEVQKECLEYEAYNDHFYTIPAMCNVKDAFNLNIKSSAAVLAITRSEQNIPLRDIIIIQDQNGYKFGAVQAKSPYIYKYMPEIIDVYPIENSINPGVAMFCFPEGIIIKKQVDMPKWFCFVLTDQYGARSYAACLIMTEELSENLIRSLTPVVLPKQPLFVEKALCVISNYPFFTNLKVFLRELYRVQVSNQTETPLERIICHFVDSMYFRKIENALCYTIAEEELKFFRIPIYGNERDTSEECIEILFSSLSIETILTLFEGLLLERKIFLISSYKNKLVNICTALVSLLFPFQWIHVLVPILPEKLKVFMESPIPLLIGMCYNVDLSEFPADAIVVNVDNNTFEKYLDRLPKLPSKLNAQIIKRLEKYKNKFDPEKATAMSSDEVFSCQESESNKFDTTEVRDIFYEFFLLMFKNYEKYFGVKSRKNQNDPLMLNKDSFLKDHSSTEPGSFLYKFTETNIFMIFEDGFKFIEPNSVVAFFLDSIKKDRSKIKYLLPFKAPLISNLIPDVSCNDLNGKKFSYPTWPKLNPELYIRTEAPAVVYQSKFSFARDEWCYDPKRLSNKDWGKYLLYIIHEIWFQLFSVVIHTYDDKKAAALMEHAMYLLNELNKKKIMPSKNLYTKLIKSCGRSTLKDYVKIMFNSTTQIYKNFSPIFQNAFMNGLYAITEGMDDNTNKKVTQNLRGSFLHMENTGNSKAVQEILDSAIFLNFEICPYCLKNKKNKKLTIEELIGGFKREKSDFSSICSVCLCKIFPKIYIFKDNQLDLNEFEIANMVSPVILLKEVDNLIKNYGEKYFFNSDYYNHNYHRHIFWNLAFYFQLFNLPLFVLHLQDNDDKFTSMIRTLESKRVSTDERSNKRKLSTATQSNRIGIIQFDPTSRKPSTASNDVISCKSSNTIFINQEKKLLTNIQTRIEKLHGNASEGERATDDRSELMTNICDIRTIISKYAEDFTQVHRYRLDSLLKNVELHEVNHAVYADEDKKQELFFKTNKSSNVVENIKTQTNSTTITASSVDGMGNLRK